MDLQLLFDSTILEQRSLDRDYSGFGNDVWIVRTAAEHVVVRVSARSGAGGAFWTGVARLFGIDSTRLDNLRIINDAVNDITDFRAPGVLRTGTIDGRAFAVTELLPGRHIDSFDDLPSAAAEAFGRRLAHGHRRAFAYCGSPSGLVSYPIPEFHVRAGAAIEWLCREYRAHDKRAGTIAARVAANLRALAPPPASSLILFDIGGSQYLWDDAGPTAVVDTEAYVYAPRELELIVLESDNGAPFAAAFRRGYESVSPLPDLAPFREPYRCLIALMEVNGAVGLEAAISAPIWL